MFRLLIKNGRKWKHGIIVYKSFEDASARKSQLEEIGMKVKITDKNGGPV